MFMKKWEYQPGFVDEFHPTKTYVCPLKIFEDVWFATFEGYFDVMWIYHLGRPCGVFKHIPSAK